MDRGLPARRGDAGNPLACAPHRYGTRMANKSKGQWGRTPSTVGSLLGGLRPPPEMLCWSRAVSSPKWGCRRGFLPWAGQGDKSRGKGIPEGFCCHRHCSTSTSQQAGGRFGWLSTAGAAKEGEQGDAEGNR